MKNIAIRKSTAISIQDDETKKQLKKIQDYYSRLKGLNVSMVDTVKFMVNDFYSKEVEK
jgi:hypothetical protein